MIVKQWKTRVFYIKIIRKYGCLFVRNVGFFSKKVRLFSQNDLLFLFYFLINLTMTTETIMPNNLRRNGSRKQLKWRKRLVLCG